jgi:hypothetical protein
LRKTSAKVINAFARCSIAWLASRTARAGLVDAFEQALPDRPSIFHGGLVYLSDRG